MKLTTEDRMRVSESYEDTCQAIENAYVNGDLGQVLYKQTMDFLKLYSIEQSETANMLALTSI